MRELYVQLYAGKLTAGRPAIAVSERIDRPTSSYAQFGFHTMQNVIKLLS